MENEEIDDSDLPMIWKPLQIIQPGFPQFYFKFQISIAEEDDVVYTLIITDLINVWKRISTKRMMKREKDLYCKVAVFESFPKLAALLEKYFLHGDSQQNLNVEYDHSIDDDNNLSLKCTKKEKNISFIWIFVMVPLKNPQLFLRNNFIRPILIIQEELEKMFEMLKNQVPGLDVDEFVAKKLNEKQFSNLVSDPYNRFGSTADTIYSRYMVLKNQPRRRREKPAGGTLNFFPTNTQLSETQNQEEEFGNAGGSGHNLDTNSDADGASKTHSQREMEETEHVPKKSQGIIESIQELERKKKIEEEIEQKRKRKEEKDRKKQKRKKFV